MDSTLSQILLPHIHDMTFQDKLRKMNILPIKPILLAAALLSGILTGCAGTHLSTEEVHQFTIGQDTEETVQKALGKPWQTFPSFEDAEVERALKRSTGKSIADYTHRIGVYTFSFSPLLSKNSAYFELNMFIYDAQGILVDIQEYTCYTQKSCADIIEAEKHKYTVEDMENLLAVMKSISKRQQEKLLLEEKKRRAAALHKKKMAEARAANVKKKESAKPGMVTTGGSSGLKTLPEARPATPAPAAPGAKAPEPQKNQPAVRRGMRI